MYCIFRILRRNRYARNAVIGSVITPALLFLGATIYHYSAHSEDTIPNEVNRFLKPISFSQPALGYFFLILAGLIGGLLKACHTNRKEKNKRFRKLTSDLKKSRKHSLLHGKSFSSPGDSREPLLDQHRSPPIAIETHNSELDAADLSLSGSEFSFPHTPTALTSMSMHHQQTSIQKSLERFKDIIERALPIIMTQEDGISSFSAMTSNDVKNTIVSHVLYCKKNYPTQLRQYSENLYAITKSVLMERLSKTAEVEASDSDPTEEASRLSDLLSILFYAAHAYLQTHDEKEGSQLAEMCQFDVLAAQSLRSAPEKK